MSREIPRHGRIPTRIAAVLLSVGLALFTGPARATAADGHHLAVGVKAGYLLAKGHGPAAHHGGGGPFFEIALIPRWLIVELGFKVMGGGHDTLMPFDLLAKIPVHLSNRLHALFGMGPTVVVAFADPDAVAHVGLATILGVELGLSARWGLLVEAGYNLIVEQGSSVHELAANAGVGFRF